MTRPDNGDKPSSPLVHHRKIVSHVLAQPALPQALSPLLIGLWEVAVGVHEAQQGVELGEIIASLVEDLSDRWQERVLAVRDAS
jgi:hypothetical protein